MSNIAIDLILVIAAGLFGGLLAKAFKQPLVLGYIFAGILVGPHTGGATVSNAANIAHLADIGVALLLFSLGLEFSIKDLKPIWRIALIGSGIQVFLTFGYGYSVGRFWGWAFIPAMWLGGIVVSSSTAIILRTLESGNVRKTLSGKIMLGVSIIQDLLVIPILILLTRLNVSNFSVMDFLKPIGGSLVFLLLMGFIASRLMPFIMHQIAKLNSSELFMLSTISIGLGIGYISFQFGLSAAFGAFISGMVLSESDFGHKALTEMIPFRNLFGMMFFASIGMLFDPAFVWANATSIIGFLIIITGGKGIILALISLIFGYHRVVPLAMFLGMIPISEMAFVLARNALGLSVISTNDYQMILSMVILSMVVGPVISTLIAPLYRIVRKFKIPDPINLKNFPEQGFNNHLIVTGSGSIVGYLSSELLKQKVNFVIIEPFYQSFFEFAEKNMPVIFGEPDKTDILEAAGISNSLLLLICESDAISSEIVIEKSLSLNPKIEIRVLTNSEKNETDFINNTQVKFLEYEKQIAERMATMACEEISRLTR